MTPDEKPHFFDNPKNFKRVLYTFYAICIVLLAIDLVFHRHVVHPWESLFGFYALFGFTACWTLVEVAKVLRMIVMRPPEYYEKD